MARLYALLLVALLGAPTAAAQQCNISRSGGVSVSPNRVQPGLTITITHSFVSVGSGPCPEIEVGHYLSTDNFFSADDLLLSTFTIPPSQPQTNLPGNGTGTIPADTPRGGYVVLAVADHLGMVPEIDEGDNVMTGGNLTVGGDANGPDLDITAAELEDPTAAPGDRITIEYTVRNRGQSSVGDFEVGFYLVRRNAGLPPPTYYLGRETLGGLDPGEDETESEQLTLPFDLPPGQYATGVMADYDNEIEEPDEHNNVRGAGFLTITAPVTVEGGAEATDLSLSVSPNPSSSAVSLSYTLAEAGEVRMAVYDVLGREVAVAAEGTRAAGEHTATLDASALAPGVYVVRLAAGADATTATLTVAH